MVVSIQIPDKIKCKRKAFPITGPVVAQRVGRVIALFFHDLGGRIG